MKTLTDEELAEIASEHGGVSEVEHIITPFGSVVMRGPKRAELKAAKSKTERDAYEGDEWLARCCVVYPTKEEFAALLEKKPGLAFVAAKAVVRLSGAMFESEGKG